MGGKLKGAETAGVRIVEADAEKDVASGKIQPAMNLKARAAVLIPPGLIESNWHVARQPVQAITVIVVGDHDSLDAPSPHAVRVFCQIDCAQAGRKVDGVTCRAIFHCGIRSCDRTLWRLLVDGSNADIEDDLAGCGQAGRHRL